MSKNKAPVPSKEMTRKVVEKSRSVSTSRRESPASKGKLKASDDAVGSNSSTDKKVVPSRKSLENDSFQSKETKTLQKKPSVSSVGNQNKTSRQAKPIPSKASQQASMSQARVEIKPALKPRSDTDVSSRSRSREQVKAVDAEKQTPRNIKPKIKANEAPKSSSRHTDRQRDELRRSVKQEGKPALPSKPTSKPAQLDTARLKEEKSKVLPPDLKHSESGGGEGVRLSRERTKTQTLSPEDSQLMTTLKHMAQQLPQDIQPEPSDEVENDYEDDFEDYESDFEEAPSLQESSEDESGEDLSKPIIDEEEDDDDKENYDYGDSSSSLSDLQPIKEVNPSANGKSGVEENKMDSGHYDLAEERRKLVNVMLDSKKTVSDNRHMPIQHISTKIQQKEDSLSSNKFEVKVINFAQAKKRQQERKASSKIKHRGEILLNMIRLDSISVPLMDKAPVPYEVYMRSYGRANTIQVSSQTNDDRMAEEAQTDEINTSNRWTQHPPALVQLDDSLPHQCICASSSDPCNTDDLQSWKQGFKPNILELEKFILNSGQLMLNILEETSSGATGLLRNNKADLGFSQGFIGVGTESVPFLNNRKVSRICFVPNQPNSLVTVHMSSVGVSAQEDLATQMVKRCILCMWSLLQPSQPVKILVANSDVTSCIFHPFRSHLLFAGLFDGVLNVWDLKDQSKFVSGVSYENREWKLLSPSYATVDHLEVKHSSAIVGVQVLDSVAEDFGRSLELSPTQICSLDESGLCIIWTLLSSSTGIMSIEDTGIAPWGCIRLVQNESFSLTQRLAANLESLSQNLQFADLALDSADTAHFLAAINTGHVAHILSSGSRAHPALYQPDWDCLSPAVCISSCPFNLPYFLVGCGDGTVRLHSRHNARPLLSVAGSGGAIGAGPAIVCLQWSNCRPCVFFALDSESRLHVWDLASSDMYPMLTIPFKGKFITTIQLSPTQHSTKACPYLALGTSCGKLKVHLVKQAFSSPSYEETAVELDKFKRYVSIL